MILSKVEACVTDRARGPGHSSLLTGDANGILVARHDIEVGYSAKDDGIWLSCACGWELSLGFNVSIEKAMEAAQEHRLAASPASEFYMSAADLARHLGVGRAAVGMWFKRYGENALPEVDAWVQDPRGRNGVAPLWLKSRLPEWERWRREPRPRAEAGGARRMRNTKALRRVLTELASIGRPTYGYEVARVTGLRAGTVYPLLARLEVNGLVGVDRVEKSGTAPPRRYLALTATGRALAVEIGVADESFR